MKGSEARLIDYIEDAWKRFVISVYLNFAGLPFRT